MLVGALYGVMGGVQLARKKKAKLPEELSQPVPEFFCFCFVSRSEKGRRARERAELSCPFQAQQRCWALPKGV